MDVQMAFCMDGLFYPADETKAKRVEAVFRLPRVCTSSRERIMKYWQSQDANNLAFISVRNIEGTHGFFLQIIES